ncbi:hypothetical protein FQN54_004443 [Arachnomyces sp. PD_36]|nr:hypothetical protein FQN54_004443 [Arachnomyces sp. PD_36]
MSEPNFLPIGSLPNEPTFVQLLNLSNDSERVAVCDLRNGKTAGYKQLITDVLALRRSIYESLPKSMFDGNGILGADTPYILVQAQNGYEYFVATFAILSIGGALVPISTSATLEEIHSLLQRCKSTCIIANSELLYRANETQEFVGLRNQKISIIPIPTDMVSQDVTPKVDEGIQIAPDRPSLILFTSGTTGSPKGVVHTRKVFFTGIREPSGDVVLGARSTAYISGVVPPVRHLLTGSRIETMEFEAGAVWERLRQGGVTILSLGEMFWEEMAQYYGDHISSLPELKREEYLNGIRSLRTARTSGAPSPPPLMKFWQKLGLRLRNTYALTETASPILETDEQTDENLHYCLGKPFPGATVRLSEGDHGEILAKGPYIFSRYLDNEESTRAAFDADGFLKTGDMAHLVGENYVMDGRKSTDFIQHNGSIFSLLEIESHMSELPYISESCLAALPDTGTGTRIAALVRFKDSAEQAKCNLGAIRSDLSNNLPTHKLPTALRVLRDGEVIPRSIHIKIRRRIKVGEDFFPVCEKGELPEDVEVWGK